MRSTKALALTSLDMITGALLRCASCVAMWNADRANQLRLPLRQDLLDTDINFSAARYIIDAWSMPAEMPLYGLLAALVSTFVGLCDDHAIDPEGAFNQITDLLHRDPARFGARSSIPADLRYIYS